MKTLHDVLLGACGIDRYGDWEKVILADPLTADIFKLQKDQVQGTLWHPEFYLGHHIFLNCKGVVRLGQQSLLETAFIHDIGKTITTDIGGSRIYSYGHDKASLELMEEYRDRFADYDLAYRITELHMKYSNPDHKKLKDDPLGQVFVTVDKGMACDLAYEFFEEDFLERLANAERILYESQKKSSIKIVMTIGISGSGKSTYLKDNYAPEVIVCPDKIREELTGDISDQTQNFRVWKIAEARLHKVLQEHGIAVLDATNVSKGSRIKLMAQFNGHCKEALVFDTDIAIAKKRVTADIVAGVNRSAVPMDVIDRQYKTFKSSFGSIWEEFNLVKEIV